MSLNKIELDESQIWLLQRYGHIVNAPDGKTYYFLPYWFECDSDSEQSFIMHSLDNLPKELMEYLENNRKK